MSNITTFGVTAASVRRFLNPAFDPNGIQIGNLFTSAAVASATARVNSRVINLNLSALGNVGIGQLAGYRIYLNTDIVTAYEIYTNTASDVNGFVSLYTTKDLPVASGNWTVIIRSTHVDFQETDVSDEILRVVMDIRGRLRADYAQMLSFITGELLWPRDMYQDHEAPYTSNSQFTLSFYKASSVKVWLGPFYEYAQRSTDATLLLSGTDYTLSHDDVLYKSYIALAEVPADGAEIAVDYFHDLTPLPESLRNVCEQLVATHLLTRNANIRANMSYEIIKGLQGDATEQLTRGIPEFDIMHLYTETKMRPRHGVGNIRALRG